MAFRLHAAGEAESVTRMRNIALLAVAFFVSQQLSGYCEDQRECKENPKIVAECFSVHARANLGADSVPILSVAGSNKTEVRGNRWTDAKRFGRTYLPKESSIQFQW